MPSTQDLCEKFYGTRDIYEIFEVTKNAQESEIKKAYYKLSLKVHPDRVKQDEKTEATEKFKVLSKIYSILSDREKRALYDEQGIIEDEDDSSGTKWMAMWQKFFKPISTDDIDDFEKVYVGSDLERNDIKEAYLKGKGCIDYMSQCVPYMGVKDEPRIAEIVQSMIASGEVPEYAAFNDEPQEKRARRHKKEAKEAKEAEALKKTLGKKKAAKQVSLEQQIAERRTEREQGFNSLLDRLAAKYGQEDEDD
ncbi:AAEL013852-PA [Aedes aegypti]|uniref:AAEL013852-PA n=2 Tax=Aedes aegypti TaxID=7159 RepID=A0A1S4G073_AEDAE|nr:J domain-containing protein CG6693 [Aedes aegypti]EAT33882.1 AAEL013852-PA [Aedes aegypti]